MKPLTFDITIHKSGSYNIECSRKLATAKEIDLLSLARAFAEKHLKGGHYENIKLQYN